jgi:hypothetical protein
MTHNAQKLYIGLGFLKVETVTLPKIKNGIACALKDYVLCIQKFGLLWKAS